MRLKKCPECAEKYQPTRQLQPCCEKMECKASYAIRHVEATRKRRRMQEMNVQRADRKVIKVKLDKLKTARDWTKEAQIAVNSYVRERDKSKPCISCGCLLTGSDAGGAFDAGHYRSRGSASHLKFDAERNIHGQCKRCNRYLGGNYSDYRTGLIDRIGLDDLEKLEADQTPRKYSIEELKAIKAKYTAMTKELSK